MRAWRPRLPEPAGAAFRKPAPRWKSRSGRRGARSSSSPAGGLEGGGASALLTRISAVIERGTTRLVLDCGGLTYINSTGPARGPHRGQGMPAGGRDAGHRRALAALPLGLRDEWLPLGHRLLGNARGGAQRARPRSISVGDRIPAGPRPPRRKQGSREPCTDRRALCSLPGPRARRCPRPSTALWTWC